MPNEGTKADDYLTIFPNTLENGKLIPIRGKPTFKTLTDLQKLLIQNAATIHKHLVVTNMDTLDLSSHLLNMHF